MRRLPDSQRLGANWAMHWGQGILLGAVADLLISGPETAEMPRRGSTAAEQRVADKSH